MSDFHLLPQEEQLFDKFAGLCMNAILNQRSVFDPKLIAVKSYDTAEAMLLERRKRRQCKPLHLEPLY